MDKNGFTENLGRKGRRITQHGREELGSSVVLDKVGFISNRVDELAYKMSFDLNKMAGTIILNVSSISEFQFPEALASLASVMDAGFGMGHLIAVGKPGDDLCGHRVAEGDIALGTVCSVTLNGVFGAAGIAMASRFGGLLELRDGAPFRFVEIIEYAGTSLDPIEIFIKGRMTNVRAAVTEGMGVVGASFRDIPAAALPAAKKVIEKMAEIGLGGVLLVGRPGRPLLDIPVPHGRAGLVVAAGLNPLAAIEEAGIETKNRALAKLFDFQRLITVDELVRQNEKPPLAQ